MVDVLVGITCWAGEGEGGREGTGEGRKSEREKRGEENSVKKSLVHTMWDVVHGCHGHFRIHTITGAWEEVKVVRVS